MIVDVEGGANQRQSRRRQFAEDSVSHSWVAAEAAAGGEDPWS